MGKLTASILLIFVCAPLSARQIDTLTLYIGFGPGDYSIDDQFSGNGENMAAFVRSIDRVLEDPDLLIYDLSVLAAASPEGDEDYNMRLSDARAASIRERLLFDSHLSPSQIRISSIGSDWVGLLSLIEASGKPWKSRAAAIIRDRTKSQEERRSALKELEGGAAWQWAVKEAFPMISRQAGVVRCVVMDRSLWSAGKAGYMKAPAHQPKEEYLKPPVVGIRTNLLLPLLNIGCDVPVNNRISVGADIYYPWVPRSMMNSMTGTTNEYCIQGFGGFLECRFWPGRIHGSSADAKYRLCGHSVAAVVGAALYDYEFPYYGTEGIGGVIPVSCGRQGEAYSVGVDYAYYLPVGKKAGLRLSFNLTIGYMMSFYKSYGVYQPGSNVILDDSSGRSEFLSWFGPVCAGVNLVVPIPVKGGVK